MAIESQNGDYNLTSAATVYNKTATVDGEYELEFNVGDGTKNLAAALGTLSVRLTVGGQVVGGAAQPVYKADSTRVQFRTGPIFVASGATLSATLKSSNASDTDVDVTVTPRLRQVNAVQCATSGGPVIAAAGGGMDIPYNTTVHFDVVTHHPKTGQATDADAAPTFEVFEEGIDMPASSGSLTKRTGRTGHYRGSFVIYGVWGYEVDKFYNVVAAATVDGVTSRTTVMTFRVVAEETSAGKPALDTAAIADAVLSRNVSQVEASAAEHSLCTVVLATLESAMADSTWTIRRTNGSTVHVTRSVTTDPDADPVTGVS